MSEILNTVQYFHKLVVRGGLEGKGVREGVCNDIQWLRERGIRVCMVVGGGCAEWGVVDGGVKRSVVGEWGCEFWRKVGTRR